MRSFDSIRDLFDRPLAVALVVASALGIGMLVLQRWVADTRGIAIVLVVAWFALVLIAALAATRGDSGLRRSALLTIGAIAAITAGAGWWTGFRETTVDEDVAVAAARASGADLTRGLRGAEAEEPVKPDEPAADPGGRGNRGESRNPSDEPARSGAGPAAEELDDGRSDALPAPAAEEENEPAPLDDGRDEEPGAPAKDDDEPEKASAGAELASASISGADGHAAEGTATVIERPDGSRVLTLTDFDADPGPDVDVYLSTSTEGVDDAVNLGDLKGSKGDQQYEIPADVDLTEHGSLVLWCIPFTTRIATAELVR